MDNVLVEVTRGQRVESHHRGHVAIVNGKGQLVGSVGDPEDMSFFRSSGKPFQAVPLVATGAADAFGFSPEELAMACASHSGTPEHQEIVRSMLSKVGLHEESLRCGYSPPIDEVESAHVTLDEKPRTLLQCECSGEHAGMVATCVHMGWDIDTYTEPDHPLQRMITEILAAASGVQESAFEQATDGCSLPTFGTSLQAIARSYAVLADPDSDLWDRPAEQRQALIRLREAMVTHPVVISGEGDIDTTIMQLTEGRVVAKLGAEGLLSLAVPGHQLGIAIRESGGASRALGPTACAIIDALGIEPGEVVQKLREALIEPVKAFSGKVVGEIRPAFSLTWDKPDAPSGRS